MTAKPELDRLRREVDRLRREVELAAEHLPPDIGLRFRAMFGGLGAYAHDRLFASLSGVDLALKLSPDDRARLPEHTGATPVRDDEHGPVSKEHVLVPPALRREPAALAPGLRSGIDHAATAPLPPRRARTERTRP